MFERPVPMAVDDVTRNLKGMDELDFAGWNSADWHGVFARYHTDDVLVDVHGQPQTHGIQEHIDALIGRTIAPARMARGISATSPTTSRR